MGCIWSNEDIDRCLLCNRRAVNNLILIDHVCEICYARPSRREQQQTLKARYGEYRCSSCGRFWTSRLSWAGTYQMCKRCQKPVYPHNQRDLQPGDLSDSTEIGQEHQKEYCQMCQQLGYNCKNFRKTYVSKTSKNNRRR